MKPQIISSYDGGKNNGRMEETVKRLNKGAAYKDLSYVLVIPALETVPTRIVSSWMSLVSPPNQRCARLFAQGMEVGEAYSQTIQMVVDHPELSKFRFIVTLEHDNAPPSDGLVKLLIAADAHPEYAAIGGLYFTKGYGGVAQIWGDPKDYPTNYRPQLPKEDELVECCGTGMGFTCFQMKIFKDKKLRRPWFKTMAGKEGVATQDLYAWEDWRKHGYRCAIDCSVKVGHWDQNEEVMW